MSGSGSINGNGGLGGIFKRLAPTGGSQVDAVAAEPTPKAKVQGDQFLIGNSSSSMMTLGGLDSMFGAAPLTAKDTILGAKNLNEFIQAKIKQDFPNLKLTPVQSAGLSTFIRDQLALTGMNDESFKDLKNKLD